MLTGNGHKRAFCIVIGCKCGGGDEDAEHITNTCTKQQDARQRLAERLATGDRTCSPTGI